MTTELLTVSLVYLLYTEYICGILILHVEFTVTKIHLCHCVQSAVSQNFRPEWVTFLLYKLISVCVALTQQV